MADQNSTGTSPRAQRGTALTRGRVKQATTKELLTSRRQIAGTDGSYAETARINAELDLRRG
jgi:hypothetical protein